MLLFALILSATGLFTAVAALVDRQYTDNKRDETWRTWLTQVYIAADEKTPHVAGSDVPALLLAISFFWIWSVGVFGIAYLKFFIFNAVDQKLTNWYGEYLRWTFYLDIPKLILFGLVAIILLLASVPLLLLSAYGLVRILAMGFLGHASAPNRSPIAYTVAVLGIAAAFGKLVIDFAKWFLV